MAEHVLTLRYEGRLAERHEMDAADIHHAYEGAKRLLALHGYVYTEGRLPRNKLTETPYFTIRARAPRANCVLIDILINVVASAIWDATKYTFREHFIPAVRSWLDGHEYHDPYYDRVQPTLEPVRGNHPFIDHEAERRALAREINSATGQAIEQITRPIGRHADYVDLIFDGQVFAQLRRRYREHEITEAVHALRDQLSQRPRFVYR